MGAIHLKGSRNLGIQESKSCLKGLLLGKKKELPFVLPNVVFVVGWFEETLQSFPGLF